MAVPSVRNLTECGICLGLIGDPKVLPCLHAFCRGCLDEWTREQVDKTQVKCPICKEDFTLPKGGVAAGLNIFVNTLKEKEELQFSLKKDQLCCTSCYGSDNKAISWCINCSEKLCENCVKCHKMLKLFEGHKLYSLDDIRANKVDVKKVQLKRFCKKHEDQTPRFFCETCGVLICRDCSVVDHQVTKHSLVNVEEISGEQLSMVTDLTDRCQKVSSDIDDKIKEVTNIQTDLTKALKKAHAEADRSMQLIKEDFLTNLEKQRQKVSEDIDERGQKANVKLLEKKDKLEKQRLQLSRALIFSKSLCENGSPYDLAAVFTPLTDTMTRLSNLKMVGVQRNLSKVTFNAAADYQTRSQVSPLGFVSSMYIPTYQDMNGVWELERKLCVGVFTSGMGIATSSSTHHFSVACNSLNKVKVFNNNGQFLTEIHDAGTDFKICSPRSVVMMGDDYLIITDLSEFVKIFDENLKLIRKFSTIPPVSKTTISSRSLSGLAVHENNLFIGDISNRYISVHKVCGKYVRSFNVNIRPLFTSISQNGNTMVLSSVDDLQIISSNDGKIIHTFPISVIPLPRATGSFFNGDNEFIIAKQSERSGIYRYGIDGKYLGCITTNVDDPTDMLMTENGKLIVLELTHIKVFKRK